jgi:hypothetical protein
LIVERLLQQLENLAQAREELDDRPFATQVHLELVDVYALSVHDVRARDGARAMRSGQTMYQHVLLTRQRVVDCVEQRPTFHKHTNETKRRQTHCFDRPYRSRRGSHLKYARTCAFSFVSRIDTFQNEIFSHEKQRKANTMRRKKREATGDQNNDACTGKRRYLILGVPSKKFVAVVPFINRAVN